MSRRLVSRAGLALAAASLLALVLAAPSTARVVDLRVYNGVYPAGSFDGTGSVGGTSPFGFGFQQMDINQATGEIIVGHSANGGSLYKFNAAGEASPFSALGGNTVITGQSVNLYGDVVVDNSGEGGAGAEGEQGRIYAFPENGPVRAYKPTGEEIGGNFPLTYQQACGAAVAPNGNLWVATWGGGGIQQFNGAGVAISDGPAGGHIQTPGICGLAIDSQENFYAIDESGPVLKYNAAGEELDVFEPFMGTEARDVAVDRSDDHVYITHETFINEYLPSGELVTSFGAAEAPFPGLQGANSVAVNETSGLAYAPNNNGLRVDTFERTGPITIPDVTTNTPSVTPTGATLKGVVSPDTANGGTPIIECAFEWGMTTSYGNKVPCDQETPINGETSVTATIGGLIQGTTYHYRLTARNSGNEILSAGLDQAFQPAGPPQIANVKVSEVNTDGARISGTIDPSGGTTEYQIEYGLTDSYGNVVPEEPVELPNNIGVQPFTQVISGLSPDTTYHFRIVATNLNGTVEGDDMTFTTFPSDTGGVDDCANKQVRQQTGAGRLLDCRAYELVSARNLGGYDVQSNLVPGLRTLTPQPGARDRVLYSVYFGAIPGTGNPTNYELDPYVAARGTSGWDTSYVGIPATPSYSSKAFGSPLAASSAGLESFAYGGEGLCDPCFPDGSQGIPVRLPNGSLVQGMKGSLDPGPSAEPAGVIRKPLSDDGRHLIFGSTSQFEPSGNNGSLTIYERNLTAGTTEVVSTLPNGSTMTGNPAQLDVSADGSRVLIGRPVSTDAAGNVYYDLFMHFAGSAASVEVLDSASGGLFAGMTADGSRVYFTTPDQITGDSDGSADLYRADVTSGGVTLTRVSTGAGAGNTDSCDPVPGKEGPHWNSASGAQNCDVVAPAGGVGVASQSGGVYFLSPEDLDGEGSDDEANLYVAFPGGSPQHVATIEPDGALVTEAVFNNEARRFTELQVSSSGRYAVFGSTLPLSGADTFGFTQIYRFDAQTGALDCASCASTGAAPTANTELAEGLNLADDGDVFFTSSEALVLRDSNGRRDVYQWENGKQELISTGISPFDAGLLSASRDGTDVFFFTRAVLVPQDQSGNLMKIYDARANGGFLMLPPLPGCAAKDECHGPGTAVAPPPQIGTFVGRGGNVRPPKRCRKGFVKRGGKCVKKKKGRKGKKGKRKGKGKKGARRRSGR